MLQKPPGDCVFKLDNFVETSGAQGLILLAGRVVRELLPVCGGSEGAWNIYTHCRQS